MKKLISILMTVSLTATLSSTLISCTTKHDKDKATIIESTINFYNGKKHLSEKKFNNNIFDFKKIKTENLKNNNSEVNLIIEKANQFLNNKYLLNDEWEMEPSPHEYIFNDGIDWNVKYNGDVEMSYMFSRMSFVKTIVKAYIYTGEEKYLDKAIDIIKDFQNSQPLNNENIDRNGGTWRTIDTGIRMDVLLLVSAVLQNENKDFKWLNDFILLHYSFLMVSYDKWTTTSNWGVFQNIYMLKLMIMFDDASLNKDKNELVNRMYINLFNQFNEDGIQIEHATMYHNEVLIVMDQLQYLSSLGLFKPTPAFNELYKKAYIYTLVDSDMNYYENSFGDSDRYSIKRFVEVSNLFLGIDLNNYNYTTLSEENEFLFSVSPKDSKIPEPNKFDYNGFDFNNSGKTFYKGKDFKLAFYNSSNDDKGHGHGDLLHFNLDYKNKNFFVDPGRYTYLENNERVELKEMKSHNTIVIDDAPVQSFKNAWGMKYEKASNIKTSVSKSNDVYKISGSYSDLINDSEISRSFEISEEKNSFTMLNETGTNKESKMYFILDPNVTVENNNGNLTLTNDGIVLEIKHQFNDSDVEIVKTPFSEKYNEKVDTSKIIFNIPKDSDLKSNTFSFGFEGN